MYLLKVKADGNFITSKQETIFQLYASIFNKGICSIYIDNVIVQIKKGERVLNYQIAGSENENGGIVKIFLEQSFTISKINRVLKSQEEITIDNIHLQTDEVFNDKTTKAILIIKTKASIFKIKKYKMKFKQVDKIIRERKGYLTPIKK
jgi:hypothetical protein